MPSMGRGCHELRVVDDNATWRIMYFVDADAVVILEVFSKKTRATPKRVMSICQGRLRDYKEVRR